MPTKKTTKKAKKETKTAAKAAPKKVEEITPEGIKIYDARKTFKKGEQIYHKFWEDTGEVIETGTTEDGVKKMLVQFESVGEKKLIMNHKVKN